ncbi:MAG: YerC/YecD family TrpR-related protein [Candidatus Paceibacterota bacterium]|jgi:TrpR-related protein YerC/YecD
MANLSKKLSKEEIGRFFYKLCLAIAETKNVQEAANFLRDLLSFQEAEMIAKRLKIAELLIEGCTYEDIRKEVKSSYGTIARVQEWMKVSGDGFHSAVNKTKGKDAEIKKECPIIEMNALKKKYPMYYWPEIVLESIIETANYKQKQKLKKVIGQMDKMKKKTDLYRKLEKLVRY